MRVRIFLFYFVVHSFTYNMEDTINVRNDINTLEIGHYADFPIERYDYVLSCRTRLQKVGVKRFSSSTEKAGLVTITRLEDAVVTA